MQFIDRFLNLAKADAHGVLDSLEDPGLVLKQCLREAENELVSNQSRRDELDLWIEQLGKQRENLATRSQTLDDEVRLSIAKGAEDLARFSIRRLLATQRRNEEIGEEIRSANEERSGLEARIAMQDAELDDLRQRVENYLARQRANEVGCASSHTDPEVGHFIREEEVELELLRRRESTPHEEVQR
jgi:phage shock protein A